MAWINNGSQDSYNRRPDKNLEDLADEGPLSLSEAYNWIAIDYLTGVVTLYTKATSIIKYCDPFCYQMVNKGM